MKRKWYQKIFKQLVGVVCLLVLLQSPLLDNFKSDYLGALSVKAATFEDINQPAAFVKQLDASARNGTCTLAQTL